MPLPETFTGSLRHGRAGFCELTITTDDRAEAIGPGIDNERYILIPAPFNAAPADGRPSFDAAERDAIGRQAGLIMFVCEDSGFVDATWYDSADALTDAWEAIRSECLNRDPE